MIRRLVLAAILSFGLAPMAAADFSRGAAALNSGDYATAYREFRPLAERGHQDAQFALGEMYRNGAGVTRDDAEAFAWFRKAAENGHAKAQNVVGYSYTYGVGTETDYFQAYFWFSLAATQSNTEAAANRDEVAPLLSAAQRAEAEGLVAQRRRQGKALEGGFTFPESPPVESETPAAEVAEASSEPPAAFAVAAIPPAEPEDPATAVAAPPAPEAEQTAALAASPALEVEPVAAVAASPAPEIEPAATVAAPPAPETEPAAAVAASLASEAEQTAALATSPSPDAFRVQLGAYRVAENAPAEWRRLKRAEADLLGGLQHRIRRLDLGDRGVLSLLQVGPLADAEAARALCGTLTERGVDCMVVSP